MDNSFNDLVDNLSIVLLDDLLGELLLGDILDDVLDDLLDGLLKNLLDDLLDDLLDVSWWRWWVGGFGGWRRDDCQQSPTQCPWMPTFTWVSDTYEKNGIPFFLCVPQNGIPFFMWTKNGNPFFGVRRKQNPVFCFCICAKKRVLVFDVPPNKHGISVFIVRGTIIPFSLFRDTEGPRHGNAC